MQLTGTISRSKPLLVAALPEEAAYFDAALPVLITGVGKHCATLSVARVLSAGPLPASIINLGTAGALRPGLTGIHEISSVVQHDFDSDGILSLTGHAFGAPVSLRPHGPVLATGDVFVSSPTVRAALAERADLVDMEGYAVAATGAAFGVPVRIVKHVSDDADGSAFRSWQSAVDECARALAGWLAVS